MGGGLIQHDKAKQVERDHDGESDQSDQDKSSMRLLA
jgi:hypothetical protein